MQNDSFRGGDDTSRKMFGDMKVAVDDNEPEHPAVNWAKIIALLCFTFGLIALMWVIRYFLYNVALLLSIWKDPVQVLFTVLSLTEEDWFWVCSCSTLLLSVLLGIADMEREISWEERLSKSKSPRKELLTPFKTSNDLVRIYLFFYSFIKNKKFTYKTHNLLRRSNHKVLWLFLKLGFSHVVISILGINILLDQYINQF